MQPQPGSRQILDAMLSGASGAVRERFAVLSGEPADGVAGRTGDHLAATDAEHKLASDQNISVALGCLDHPG